MAKKNSPSTDNGANREAVPECVREAQIIFQTIAEICDEDVQVWYHGGFDLDGDALYVHAMRMRSLIDRIGWLADLGAGKTGGTVLKSGPEAWMLPPVWPANAAGADHA